MKELSIEQKAKAYDEAKARMSKAYNSNRCTIGFMNEIFPEFKDEDERIKEEIINYFECQSRDEPCRKSIHDKWIGWLKKQGQTFTKEDTDNANKVEPKFKAGNWYQCTKDFFGKGVTFDKNTAYYCAQEGCLQNEYGCHIAIVKDLYDNFKLWAIQDAKDGDVLADNVGVILFKGIGDNNVINFHAYFSGLFAVQEGEHYWGHIRECTLSPATKEQRERFFAAMHDAGYEWDAEKKELKKIKHESIDKVESKFKTGEWVVTSYGKVNQVIAVDEDGDGFTLDDDTYFSGLWKDNYHLWTIADAKNGDVLAVEPIEGYPNPFIAIYKERGLDFFNSYCFIGFDGNFYKGDVGHSIENIHPATKEQCNTLMKAMADAGWEFDFEKKELKKISQRMISAEAKEAMYGKPTAWSEEDERIFRTIISDGIRGVEFDMLQINWLKSLKQRIGG